MLSVIRDRNSTNIPRHPLRQLLYRRRQRSARLIPITVGHSDFICSNVGLLMASFKSKPNFQLLQNTAVNWVLPKTFTILSYAELYDLTIPSHRTFKVFKRFLLRIHSGTTSIQIRVCLWCLFCSKESSGLSQFSHIHFHPNSIQPDTLPSKSISAMTTSFQIQFGHSDFLPDSIRPHTLPSKFNSNTCYFFHIQFDHMLFLPNSIQSHPLASKFL